MTTILGIDGGLGGFSAAVLRDAQTLAAIELPGNVALEQGLAAIHMAMQQAGVAPSSLDGIAVGIGPGGFTGVRIAISYAKSLALGWRLPLTGISSFDALETGLHADVAAGLLTVVHGRPGVVSARLRKGGQERRASGYVADVLDQLVTALAGSVAVLGDSEDVIAALGERGVDVQRLTRVIEPAAVAIATVAMQREPARSLHEVRADYGELPAAKVPKSL